MNDFLTRRAVVVVLPLCVFGFFLTAATHFNYTPDDTYIYLQFARNIVHGNGVAFNAGQPTYGFTGPLWLFIVALGGKFGIDFLFAAKGIDLIFASLAILVFYFLAMEMIRDQGVALLATVAFSVNVWLMRWAGSGMETSLGVLLLLGVILYCLRNEYLVSMVLAGMLTLVRPETCVVTVFIFADMVMNSVDRREAFQNIGRLVLGYAVVVVPWLVYAYATFGTVVPNTARAKSDPHATLADMAMSIWTQMKIVGFSDGLAVVTLIVTVILVVRLMYNNVLKQERFVVFRQGFVAGAMIMVLPVMYTFSGAMMVSRYLLSVTPLIGLLAFAYLFHYLNNSKFVKWTYSIIIGFTILIVVQNQLGYWKFVKPGIEEFEAGEESCLIPIGKWLKENSPPPDIVLVWDVGAIGYYSERTIRDGFGLVSPEMIPLIHAGLVPDKIMQDRLYQSICKASFIVYRSPVSMRWDKNDDLVPVLTKTFDRMGLAEEHARYYTVYKVINHSE